MPSYETPEMLVNVGEGMLKELNSNQSRKAIAIPINQSYNPSSISSILSRRGHVSEQQYRREHFPNHGGTPAKGRCQSFSHTRLSTSLGYTEWA